VIPDEITSLVGKGTFGKVVKGQDQETKDFVAIKISNYHYRDSALSELRVLAALKASDPENRNQCLHCRDYFEYSGHICIVMDYIGPSVEDVLYSRPRMRFARNEVQNFAQQLFRSVACKSS
jgi:serine/threonine protein kinase